MRLGIVSNGPTVKQRRKVEVLGLADRIGTLLISEALGIAKPDERIFRMAASQLGVEPSACLFIGDNPEKDVCAAAAVGMRAVWFPAKLPWPDNLPAPRERVSALGELPALLGISC
jgi:putative hydrolase of the HAD superfamily